MHFETIRHIENLLHEHKCVVVEGLGAFVLQHESAVIANRDTRNGNQITLSAPQSRISFHAGLQHDDGLLISAIARQQKMSYVAARQYLMQEVQALRTALQTNSEVQMGRLGSLKAEGDTLTFIPRSNAWLADNLGAVAVTLPATTRDESLETGITNQEYITIRLHRERVRYAAACVIGAILLSIAPRGQVSNTQQYAVLSPVDYAAIIAEKEAARQAEQEAIRLQEKLNARPKNCHIVVASLDKRAAQKYCQRLQAQGYENAQIKPYKHSSRVIIDSFETRREALAAMNDLRQNTPYKRAWVWIVK